MPGPKDWQTSKESGRDMIVNYLSISSRLAWISFAATSVHGYQLFRLNCAAVFFSGYKCYTFSFVYVFVFLYFFYFLLFVLSFLLLLWLEIVINMVAGVYKKGFKNLESYENRIKKWVELFGFAPKSCIHTGPGESWELKFPCFQFWGIMDIRMCF